MIEAPDYRNRIAFSLPELPKIIPFGQRTIERMISAGEFPHPDQRKGRKKIWMRKTVEKWMEGPREVSPV